MSAHTKKRRTEALCTLQFVGPPAHANGARKAMEALGFEQVDESVPWREVFPQWKGDELPGVTLAGARHKEGLTQVQLAKQTGIPQRHISEMENNKRSIGKERARKLAKVLNISYKALL